MSECEIFCLPCVVIAACFAVCNCQGGAGNCCTGCGFLNRGCGKCCGGHDPSLDRYTAEVERDMIAERERRQHEQTAGYGIGPSMPVPQARNPTDRRERGARDHDVEQWKRGVEENLGSEPSRNDSTHRSRQVRSEELEYPPNTYSGDRRSSHDEKPDVDKHVYPPERLQADRKLPWSNEARSREDKARGPNQRESSNPYDGFEEPGLEAGRRHDRTKRREQPDNQEAGRREPRGDDDRRYDAARKPEQYEDTSNQYPGHRQSRSDGERRGAPATSLRPDDHNAQYGEYPISPEQSHRRGRDAPSSSHRQTFSDAGGNQEERGGYYMGQSPPNGTAMYGGTSGRPSDDDRRA